MSAPRPLLLAAGCAALALPVGAVAVAQSALVEPLAGAVVASLLRVSAPLASPATPAPGPASEAAAMSAVVGPDAIAAVTKPGPSSRKPAPSSKPGPLFVSGAKVLALAESQARPTGRFVAGGDGRPPGLLLAGVAPLGIGLHDGDLLVEALGATPQSPGQVIGAIIEARAQQARFLSGTVWRGGQTFRITVEQPYLPHGSP